MKVTIKTVPAKGDVNETEIEISADGVSLKDALEQAGKPYSKKFRYLVNGEDAVASTHVPHNASVEIKAIERPKGS